MDVVFDANALLQMIARLRHDTHVTILWNERVDEVDTSRRSMVVSEVQATRRRPRHRHVPAARTWIVPAPSRISSIDGASTRVSVNATGRPSSSSTTSASTARPYASASAGEILPSPSRSISATMSRRDARARRQIELQRDADRAPATRARPADIRRGDGRTARGQRQQRTRDRRGDGRVIDARGLGRVVVRRVAIDRVDVIDVRVRLALRRVLDEHGRPLNPEVRALAVGRRAGPREVGVGDARLDLLHLRRGRLVAENADPLARRGRASIARCAA